MNDNSKFKKESKPNQLPSKMVPATAAVMKSAAKQHLSKSDTIKRDSLDDFTAVWDPLKKELTIPTASKNKSTSRLLALPAEIRNRIYEFAIVDPKPISITWNDTCTRYKGPEQPTLCMVSKQLRTETLPMFYGLNTLELPVPPVEFWYDEIEFDPEFDSRFPDAIKRTEKMKAIRRSLHGEAISIWTDRVGPLNCLLMKRVVLYVAAYKDEVFPSLSHDEKVYSVCLRRSARDGIGELLDEAGIEFQVELRWRDSASVDYEEASQSAYLADLGDSFEQESLFQEGEKGHEEFWAKREEENEAREAA